MRVNCCAKNGASKRTGRGWGGKEGKRLQTNPWILKTAHLACHAWVRALTFDAVISCLIHWPIKCLAFLGVEMNFRGRVCETKIINVIFCILDCVDGANGEISMNPNDQCRLCSFVLLIRLKGTATRVKFWSFCSKRKVGFEGWNVTSIQVKYFRSATHIYTSSKLS